MSKFSLGLYTSFEPYFKRNHKFDCCYLLEIKDEIARFEISELLHSASIIRCNNVQFNRISREGNEKLVKWLVDHGYPVEEDFEED